MSNERDKSELRVKYAEFIVILIIRILFVVALIVSLLFRKLDIIVPASLGTFFIFLPVFIRRITNFVIIPEVNLLFILFIFASLFLGEIGLYYEKVWWWDIMLHLFSAIMLGFIGISLVYFLNHSEQIHVSLSPVFIVLFAFCFAIMCGVIWEIIEFTSDQLFGTNTQRSGLIDTMWDLITDTVGAFIAALIGFFYLQKGKKSWFMNLTFKAIVKNGEIRPSIIKVGDKAGLFNGRKQQNKSKE